MVWEFGVAARRASELFTAGGQLLGTRSTSDLGLADVDGDLDAAMGNIAANEVWLNEDSHWHGCSLRQCSPGQMAGNQETKKRIGPGQSFFRFLRERQQMALPNH